MVPKTMTARPTTDARAAIMWWTALGILVLLVWIAPAIPSQDGPSHLYNLILFNGLWEGDPH